MVAIHLADFTKQGFPVFDVALYPLRRVLDLKVAQYEAEGSRSQRL
jgi:hypothetical protein